MTFQVIIPSARAENLVPCVRSLLANEPALSPHDILVIDDGARAEAEPHLPGVCWITGATPFIFARNINRGLAAATADVVLLNDDARLLTYQGFSRLIALVLECANLAICSAGIQGVIGNPRQLATRASQFRPELRSLAFVCVCIPRWAYQTLGPLDERFTGYGYEDDDYCRRALAAGLRLGTWDGCIVDHSGGLPSTFRTRPDLFTLFEDNRRRFATKWEPAMNDHRRVDLMYLACNRLEFTQETFSTLVANTDWACVRELCVYDDGSVDGTAEWLAQAMANVPAPARLVRTRYGSPVTAMVHFIEQAQAPILAKTDNDAMLPPGWLSQSLAVLDRHPELTLLGIEAMYPHAAGPEVARSYTPAEFISGLGLYRREAFRHSRPVVYDKWFGLEEWQVQQGPGLVRGWITPALPVFLLDRAPFEPWLSHCGSYISRGWQRSWPKYDTASTLWQWRWPAPPVAQAAPLFLGALRIKNEAEHIQEALTRALTLCQRIFVFDDHSNDDTVAICQSFGERVTVFPSPFQGLDEARDKNYLLRHIIEANPDWVLWIDGDEVLERQGAAKLRHAASAAIASAAEAGAAIAYALQIAYVWDDPDHVRVDGIFGRFTRPSFFRLRGQPVSRLHFPSTGFGGNFHCGNVPTGLVGALGSLDVRLKHFGYMTRAQRQTKYHWYTTIDKGNVLEDEYRHLAEIPGARHAPGPPQIVPWVE